MNVHATGQPIEILLVEDNPGDVRLTQEALKESRAEERRSRGACRRQGQ
jgi:hypothetical protein